MTDIKKSAVGFFQLLLSNAVIPRLDLVADLIPNLVEQQDNELLIKRPTLDEVKAAVFQIQGDSAAGPDGFPSSFFSKMLGYHSSGYFRSCVGFL